MKFMDAVSRIMVDESRRVTKAELARRRGVTPQTVNSMFSEGRKLSVDVAADTARVLDYRLVLMPCAAKLPAASFEIDS